LAGTSPTHRRLRTRWLLRERYRRAADVATVAGGLAGATVVALTAWDHPGGAAPIAAPGLLTLVLVWVGGGMLVPRLLVRLVWRLHRRRRHR